MTTEQLIIEKAEIDVRLASITGQINSAGFALVIDDEQLRIAEQRQAMHDYSAILGERIAALEQAGEGVK
jgi:hypothetical protein